MDVICVIGHFGRYQAVLLLLVLVITFPVTFTFLNTPFFRADVDRWCRRAASRNTGWIFNGWDSYANSSVGFHLFKCFPANERQEGTGDSNLTSSGAVPFCDGYRSWDPPVSQPTAICWSEREDSALQVTMIAAVATGSLVFGVLSDVCGRRRCLLLALLLSAASSLVAALAPVPWLFHATRFVACMAAAALPLGAVLLYAEAVGRKHRALLIFALGAGLAAAGISLQTLSLHLSNWWYLQLSSGIITLLALPLLWVVLESPRWLVATGKMSSAEEVLLEIMKINRGPHLYMEVIMLELEDKVGTYGPLSRMRMLDLFATANRRQNACILFVISLVALVTQQGIPVVASATEGRSAAVLLCGVDMSLLVQILLAVFPYFMAVRCKRRYSLFALAAFLSTAYICAACVPREPNVITMAVSASIMLFSLYLRVFLWLTSVELFPTILRGAGLGCCWAFANLGLLVAPVLSLMGVPALQPVFNSILLASVAMLGAALALFLPVTHSHILPDTFHELHQFQSENSTLVEEDPKSTPKKLLHVT